MTAEIARATRVVVRVPAKVNLELRVGPLRDDGFHDLATTFHAVDIFDEVTVTPDAEFSVSVTGVGEDKVPTDETNLAYRAAALLAERFDVEERCAIRIVKAIPVAGGMAGGSADAAATLVACDTLWGLDLRRHELEEIAAELGSDVPFALTGGTALGTGRGEQIVPVLATGTFEWLFALTHEGLSTPSVYAECDRLREGEDVPEPQPSDGLLASLRSGDVHGVALAMHNDLESAALSLMPSLRPLMEMGLEMGALCALVSGSGPTVAFLLKDRQDAVALRRVLEAGGLADDFVHASSTPHGAQVLVVD
ncbi:MULTISPECIES: 4-(cytidine 5'-diphospho)-2-C-methyl-D-erythritol kinase [unclassified Dermacoccus]|uniref:4-(cytidine 5'-diphospho)-2-C-methyl-D-erythritol kinase n=1 Tax=unclassified Dermacoccus TaxID=2643059 RepID=UPI00101DA148|nr:MULTISPECIES: 4-(cytidine 5'-diphospho)-2-C-methyl-D-erythritol kinase [unclassified Dermacoccus]MBZ4497806.1 4-(cytidine 5'-diphospho)-2-C-methyl-D-erythritol kinase [Dermacoccus sp. Tok2021]RYI21729.1 4-(cytidine 5'-diphospho)-2-C-methyl-D-erythritol kinase [Dermacoccus sp. 147Ba]